MERTRRAEPSAKIDALAHAVIGAAIEVHRALGPGSLEDVYARALGIELRSRRIPFEPKKHVRVSYEGELVGEGELDIRVDGAPRADGSEADPVRAALQAQQPATIRAMAQRAMTG